MGFLAFTVIPAAALMLLSLLVLAIVLIGSGKARLGGTEAISMLALADGYSRRSVGFALLTGWLLAFACTVGWGLVEELLGLRDAVAEYVELSLNLGLTVSSSAFGVVALAILACREARSPLVDRSVRSASLERRRFRDYARGWALALVGLGLVCLVGLMVVGLIDPHATPFFFVHEDGTGDGYSIRTLGPWFGVGNALVVGVLVILELGVAVIAGRGIVRRAQIVPADDRGLDTAIRRRSADALTGSLLIALSLPNLLFGAGMSAVGGLALGERPVLPPEYVGIGVGALCCAGVGLVLLAFGTWLLWDQRRADAVDARDEGAAA